MDPTLKWIAGLAAVGSVVMLALAAPAQAAPSDRVYFRVGDYNCAIAADDAVGCDLGRPLVADFPIVGEVGLPWPGLVQQMVIDEPWLPAHPGSAPGAFTRAGGNPDISVVATSHSMYEKRITRGGVTCAEGFLRDLSCSAKGHNFSVTVYGVHAR